MLANYTMETKRLLGHGGFALVYLVTRKSDGDYVAMKKSKLPIHAMEPKDKMTFKREVEAMK